MGTPDICTINCAAAAAIALVDVGERLEFDVEGTAVGFASGARLLLAFKTDGLKPKLTGCRSRSDAVYRMRHWWPQADN